MQLGEVALSLPSMVDRHGIMHVLPVALSRSEQRTLEASAEVVQKKYRELVSDNTDLASRQIPEHEASGSCERKRRRFIWPMWLQRRHQSLTT